MEAIMTPDNYDRAIALAKRHAGFGTATTTDLALLHAHEQRRTLGMIEICPRISNYYCADFWGREKPIVGEECTLAGCPIRRSAT